MIINKVSHDGLPSKKNQNFFMYIFLSCQRYLWISYTFFSFLFGTGFYTLLHSDGARIQPSATKFLREQKSIDSEIGVQTVSL
jgi:hypothetical protein